MRSYIIQLLGFAVLLTAIPLLMNSNNVLWAKVAGVIVVVGISVSLRYWLYKTGKIKPRVAEVKLNANDKFYLDAHSPLIRSLEGKEKKEFLRTLTRVLAEFDFDCEREGLVSRDEGLAFAALFSILIYREEVKSQKNKIVVFTIYPELKMFMQGKTPVLMVDFKTIEQELEKINRFEDVSNLPENLRNTIKSFNDLVNV